MTIQRMRGFSLIEAMISLVILTIGVLGVTKMQLTMSASTHLAREREMATSIATNRFEEMRDAGICVTDAGTTAITPHQSSSVFYMQVECPSSSIADITVTWTDSSGATNNVTMHSSVALIN